MKSAIISGGNTYLWIHIGVVKHSYELFHEVLAGDLIVQSCFAFVHKDIKQAKAEENYFRIILLEASKQPVGHDLRAKELTKYVSERYIIYWAKDLL